MDKNRKHFSKHVVNWDAGLPLHLETEDQSRLGPWWCHRGPHCGQNPCDHCNDFRTEDKEACGSQLGVGLKGKWWHFQWAIKKEVGSDRTPSPCQCILFELDALQGRWVRLLFLFFHLLNPDTMWAEQTCGHVPLWSREPSWKEGY